MNYRNGEKGTTPRYVEIRVCRIRLHIEYAGIDIKKVRKDFKYVRLRTAGLGAKRIAVWHIMCFHS